MAHRKRIKSTPSAHARMKELAWRNRTSINAMAGRVVERAAALPMGDELEKIERASLVIEANLADIAVWEKAMRVAQSRNLTIGELLDSIVQEELEKVSG